MPKTGFLISYTWIFFFFFGRGHMSYGILVPWPGMVPALLALEVQSLNHWTAREVSGFLISYTHPTYSIPRPFHLSSWQIHFSTFSEPLRVILNSSCSLESQIQSVSKSQWVSNYIQNPTTSHGIYCNNPNPSYRHLLPGYCLCLYRLFPAQQPE